MIFDTHGIAEPSRLGNDICSDATPSGNISARQRNLSFVVRHPAGAPARGGAISVGDLLVVVLVADAAQNAMASDYKSITEGVLLVGTIVGWDYFLNWLGYRSRWVHDLLRPAPLPLIKDGRLLRRNLRQELITTNELMSELRQQGIESVDAVRRCYLEGDGHFSVITEPGEKSEYGKKKSLTS